MSFYICHCGNTNFPHNFRHPFEKLCKVINKDNIFTLNALDFPLKKDSKCSVPNCNAIASVHDSVALPHKYIPQEYSYREIKLTLPENSYCHKCKIFILNHKKQNHHFTTKVNIKNLNDTDKVFICHPEDEDIKIINS